MLPLRHPAHGGLQPDATSDPASLDYCMQLLGYPDPQPQAARPGQGNLWRNVPGESGVKSVDYPKWVSGVPVPRPGTDGRSWFRVLQDGPPTQTNGVYGVPVSGVTQNWSKNPVGTIRWIQRLLTKPSTW